MMKKPIKEKLEPVKTVVNKNKSVMNKEYTKKILNDITAINFTEQEVSKISSFVRAETGVAPLFTYINDIYCFISANFKDPSRIIIIPFIDERNIPHLNIHKIIV